MAFKRRRSYGKKNTKRRRTSGTFTRGRTMRKYRVRSTRLGVSNGFPMRMKFKHKYVQDGTITISSGALTHKAFNATGMYDPDPLVGGHQPMYYDQVNDIYNHYTVIGSKIKWTLTPFTDQTLSSVAPVKVVAWHNDDTTVAYSDLTTIQEQPATRAKHLMMGPDTKPLVITQTYSAKKTFGGSVMANQTLQGTTGANAPEGHFFQISCKPIDNAANVTFHYSVEINYIAVWKERKEMVGS